MEEEEEKNEDSKTYTETLATNYEDEDIESIRGTVNITSEIKSSLDISKILTKA